MQDVVDTFTGRVAVVQAADVTLDELETLPLLGGHGLLHLVQVVPVAGGEVVQADHRLAQPQQLIQKVAADETGDTGYQPFFRIFL